MSNVIPFPSGKRPEPKVEPKEPPRTPKKPSKGRSVKSTAGVVAIALFTMAVNHISFSTVSSETSMSSQSRGLASVSGPLRRDADWERDLAESLASVKVRRVASIGVGHMATPDERLRWGTLEEKYTITYRDDIREISSVLFQNDSTQPSYVLDRQEFLSEYGSLLRSNYASAQLKSVETTSGVTVESYTLLDKDNQPQGEVRFELDRHKRLLSLKVEPVQL